MVQGDDFTVRVWDVASGREVDGYTLNGQSPGPLIQAMVGQLVQVRLVNEAGQDVARGFGLQDDHVQRRRHELQRDGRAGHRARVDGRRAAFRARGGHELVVTPAQQLMLVVPIDSKLEAEAMIDGRAVSRRPSPVEVLSRLLRDQRQTHS